MHLPDRPRADPHFWRAVGLTFGLACLVAVATTGGLTWLAAVMLASTVIAFGAFYLIFPHGLHMALALSTMLAAYMSLFVFFLEANFPRTLPWERWLGFAMPVFAFLAGAWVQRARIGAVIASDRRQARFEHLLRWAVPIALVGVATFVLADLRPTPRQEGLAFLAAMAAIAVVVGFAARDVVVFILDTSLIFEGFLARALRLAQPVFAFFTIWALLAIVFASLYRIVDIVAQAPQFVIGGRARPVAFAEALYFSVVTLATVGYGDIAPATPLVRVLAVVEIISGLVLLLFGFHEIMRHVEERERRAHPDRHSHRELRDRPAHGPH